MADGGAVRALPWPQVANEWWVGSELRRRAEETEAGHVTRGGRRRSCMTDRTLG
jgi:hypothetical protein